jgi:acyl-CoA-dependent ceramide synthase
VRQYIYFTSPYYLNLTELWTQWPNREISGLMKGYMLAQLGFWVQQILVINIEERRKDHWQMFTHHIVTISLIFASYRYGLTRVGNLVLVLMDVVDLFLPVRQAVALLCRSPADWIQAAKCLKYMGYTTICDVMFGVFMVSWLFARHLFYLMVCWSVYHHTAILMPDSCYTGIGTNVVGPLKVPTDRGVMYMFEPLWDSKGLVCYNDTVRWTFLSMLLFLQALTIMWFCLIIRVAHRVITGAGSDDPRSDDEVDDLDDEDEIVYEEVAPLEEEVGVDEIDLKNWERRAGVTRQASASTGVSLPGHSDRKELLGRIGCEKQVD